MSENKFRYDENVAVVETTKGKVRGYEYNDVWCFKGIPYAKAKRFHAPEPADAWEDVYDATNYGYVCPLMSRPMPFGELQTPHRYWIENENCLNLNIWTPATKQEKLPVVVWLHGGGFTEGSSIEQVAYDGENMCRYGNVVAVSLNHRVNLLGFCDLSEYGEEYKNSANAGMDDIVAALQWIHDNIGAFGGDAGNVTIFGQSGGGEKVAALLQTPAADGLYHKGMIMSGVLDPGLEDNKGSGKDLITAMLKELQTEDVKVLETIDYQKLITVYNKVSPALKAQGKYVGLVPNPNAYYKGMPIEHGFREETAQIPLIVGCVYGEMATAMKAENVKKYKEERLLSREEQIIKLEDLLGREKADEVIAEFETAYPERPLADLHFIDMVVRCPSKKFIDLRKKLNQTTYSYMFNQNFSLNGGTTPWHCSDIPFVFHNTGLIPVTQMSGITQNLEKQMFSSLMAFARTGNPSNDTIPEWPACNDENENVMIFDEHTRMIPNNDQKLLEVLKTNYGPVYGQELKGMMEMLFGDKWMKMWTENV